MYSQGLRFRLLILTLRFGLRIGSAVVLGAGLGEPGLGTVVAKQCVCEPTTKRP